MKLTRKTALRKAIEAVSSSSLDEETRRAVTEKLELCIRELPFARWTEDAIFDACDQFIEDHGRPIRTSDFIRAGLPSHPTVKNRFNMTVKEFRDTYYPSGRDPSHSPYRDMTAEEVREVFLREYRRIRPTGRDAYDRERGKGVPCAATVVSRTGSGTWTELLKSCGLEEHPRSRRRAGPSLSVTCTSEMADRYRELAKRIAGEREESGGT